MFQEETEFKLGQFVRSYMLRESRVVDELNGAIVRVVKKYFDKSAPQGSLLSPIFWRMFDGICTKLYKINLETLMTENQDIIMISHISYADDHLTVITFMIKKNSPQEVVCLRMSRLLGNTRGLLQDATVQMGCGINPIKSENVVPEKFCQGIDLNFENDKENDPNIYKGKHTFKWLGYWLTLLENHELIFNEKKMMSKIMTVVSYRNEVFQYTRNIWLKYKIYKIFIAPFVELFLPMLIQHKTLDITPVHTLQHKTLCNAVEAAHT